ncbi:DedA family protein [Poseidonibacter lekithochrous]|uniref:DedA family protein n=1 Tax=Poseidonibacter TaxID=2321187 RepID=UPI001C0A4AA8|nr:MULTISPECIES: DedA family protein [Poseidonibacter]MBU3013241.1 DedA family protein [Poseidonibacter lekithochrous]MDO6826538.1 DedA family protein [Poseidonibacter sp. 1_MG-2023]
MEELIKDWGYIALFAYSFGGGFVGLIVAGVLSFAGDLNIYISIAVAATSNFLGDQFLFFLARKNKSYAKDMMKNYGRKIALAHLMMRKYGSLVVFIQKYVYGIKTLIPLAMGLTKYSSIKFTIFNIFATIVWAVVVGYGSYTAGEYILSVADDFKYVGIGLVLVIALVISYMFKRIDKK